MVLIMNDITYYGKTADPLVIVEKNFFDKNELDGIWQELNFLTYKHKLYPPNKTNSATDSKGKPLKSNKGLFITGLYADPYISNILTIYNNKINWDYIDFLIQYNPLFRHLRASNKQSTLLSYYEGGDYYKPHHDLSAMTLLSYFFEEPKQFTGGNIIFNDFDLEIEIQNNMIVIFPSCYQHEVQEIKMEGKSFDKKGRYCISQFISYE